MQHGVGSDFGIPTAIVIISKLVLLTQFEAWDVP